MGRRIVPYSATYDMVEKLDKRATILLYLSTVLSISITLLSYFKYLPDFHTPLVIVNSALICLFAFFDQRANYIFTKAEMRRRLDWLDNSFETNFSGKKSENYFTNEHLSPGLYKLSVNCFENSHHTQFIISKMLLSQITWTVVVLLTFIVSAVIGNREIVILFIELSLPAIFFQKLIKIIFYSVRINGVYDRFKSLFNDLLHHEFDGKTAEALRAILEYETTLSWASTPLKSKIFWQNKKEMANEWEDLKKEYKIKE
jgi:hypothetical protein